MYDPANGRTVKLNGQSVQCARILNGIVQSLQEKPITTMKEPNGVPIPVPTNVGCLVIKDGKVVVSIVFPNQAAMDEVKKLGLKPGDNINADVLPKLTQVRPSPNGQRTNAPRYVWHVSIEVARPVEVSIEA